MKNLNTQYAIRNTQYRPSGQIFLMSILILSAVMTSALLLMSIFIKDFRQSIETSESVKAFYAADSAMEWQIYCSLNNLDDSGCMSIKPEMKNLTEYENRNYYLTTTNNIKTTGVSKKVRRGLEVNFSQ